MQVDLCFYDCIYVLHSEIIIEVFVLFQVVIGGAVFDIKATAAYLDVIVSIFS